MPRFPKSSRLFKPAEFENLRRKALSTGNNWFWIRWAPSEKRRLGIIVSKKVAKANQRNLIKRIIRESFRLHPEKFPLGDVIIIAREPSGGLKRKSIRQFLWKALQKER